MLVEKMPFASNEARMTGCQDFATNVQATKESDTIYIRLLPTVLGVLGLGQV